MAQIIDTRSSGGELIVLGRSFTLPFDQDDASVVERQGSLRFNPNTQTLQVAYRTDDGAGPVAWASVALAQEGPITGDGGVILGDLSFGPLGRILLADGSATYPALGFEGNENLGIARTSNRFTIVSDSQTIAAFDEFSITLSKPVLAALANVGSLVATSINGQTVTANVATIGDGTFANVVTNNLTVTQSMTFNEQSNSVTANYAVIGDAEVSTLDAFTIIGNTATIDTATITNLTAPNASIANLMLSNVGVSLATVEDLVANTITANVATIGALASSNATLVTATATTLAANTLTANVATLVGATISVLTAPLFSGSDATISNVSISALTLASGEADTFFANALSTDTLVSGMAGFTTLTAATGTITDLMTTNASVAALSATNASMSNVDAVNVTASLVYGNQVITPNATLVTATVTTLNVANANASNINAVLIDAATLLAANATLDNATIANLDSPDATFTSSNTAVAAITELTVEQTFANVVTASLVTGDQVVMNAATFDALTINGVFSVDEAVFQSANAATANVTALNVESLLANAATINTLNAPVLTANALTTAFSTLGAATATTLNAATLLASAGTLTGLAFNDGTIANTTATTLTVDTLTVDVLAVETLTGNVATLNSATIADTVVNQLQVVNPPSNPGQLPAILLGEDTNYWVIGHNGTDLEIEWEGFNVATFRPGGTLQTVFLQTGQINIGSVFHATATSTRFDIVGSSGTASVLANGAVETSRVITTVAEVADWSLSQSGGDLIITDGSAQFTAASDGSLSATSLEADSLMVGEVSLSAPVLTFKNGLTTIATLTDAGTLSAATLVATTGEVRAPSVKATQEAITHRFDADSAYAAGTLVCLGGSAEVTETTSSAQFSVIGVVVSSSGMGLGEAGSLGVNEVRVATAGRVTVNASGAISKGDLLVSSTTAGHVEANNSADANAVIGRAITGQVSGTGTIEMFMR